MTDLFSFTYVYGNGDSYSGYGYADTGSYYAGQYIGYADGSLNATGYDGYYYISSVASSYGDTAGFVTVDSYYDGDTGYGYAYQASGGGYSGLGSESGNAYNSDYSNAGSSFGYDYYEADLYDSAATDLYSFTYVYGNGDFYSGYGYADANTYYSGQYIGYADGNLNATGYDGYYYINSVASGYSSTAGSVTVDSYYDYDSGYGHAYQASGGGYSGLGSESGNAYNSDYSNAGSSFGYDYYEADLYDSAVQQYSFTYDYGNGDTYSGYFYAYDNAYSVGESYDYYTGTNQAGYDGVYTIDAVTNTDFDSSVVGLVTVSSYYDGDYSGDTYTPYYYSQGLVSGNNGLGSEFDYIEYVSYDFTDNAYTNYYSFGQDYYEADVVVAFS